MDQVLLLRIVVALVLVGVGIWLLYVAQLARSTSLERRRWYGRAAGAELFSDDAWFEAQLALAPWAAGGGYATLLGGVAIAVSGRAALVIAGLALGSGVVLLVSLIVGVSLSARAARAVVRGTR